MKRTIGVLSVLSILSIVLTLALPVFAEGDHCVVDPEALAQSLQQPTGKAMQIGSGSWVDGVYLLPFSFAGTYDKVVGGQPNGAPRQWVTQSFFDDSPDAYDFVVVFTNFEWDSGAALGVYWSIENNVEGIGQDLFDYSQFWGSENLEGYIDGRLLSEYILADGSLDETRLHSILNHEIGHRWLVHPSFLDDGTPSQALLGRDGSHWSYLLDSEASYLYGSQWSDNGDGTFTATGVMDRYSHLDLYLMGLLAAEEVPDSTLLVNPAIASGDLPSLGVTIEATARTVSVDDVIAAEGPRIPSEAQSERDFRVGLVFLVDPAIPVTQTDLNHLNAIRSSWEESFFRQTRGQAIVEVVSPPEIPSGGATTDLNAAISWLVASVNAGGGVWSDSPLTWVRETSDAVIALDRIGGHGDVVTAAIARLMEENPAATELEARRLLALTRHLGGDFSTPAEALIADRESDGGWAAFPRYTPDCVTTARAIRALHAAGELESADEAWAWLVSRQNPDGGWSWQEGLTSATVPTEEVLLVARNLYPDFWDFPMVQTAVQWLLDNRVDGGFGEPFPNTEGTALFLMAVDGQALDQSIVQEAVDFLAVRQRPDGSWESSAYATALAVNALASFALPDPFVDGGLVFADPERPYDDNEVDLLAVIRNTGLPLDAGTPYRWEAWIAGESPAMLWAEGGVLPAVSDIGFLTLATTISPPLPADVYEIRLVIDPERTVPQKERNNDTGIVVLEVRTHPEGVDLELLDSNLSLDPAVVSSVPQPFVVGGVVNNQGQTDAADVIIRIFDGDPSNGVVLGEGVVSVPALGFAGYSIPASVSEARSLTVTVVADPDRLIDDVDRFNNTALRAMPLRYQVDLEIVSGSLVATPTTAPVGETLLIEAVVRNAGTLPVSAFQVVFSYEWGTPVTAFPIEALSVQDTLAPNETASVAVSWSPNVGGDPLPVFLDVDPGGATGDVDPSNNRDRLDLVIPPSDLPNLVVGPTSFTLAPDPPLQGAACLVGIAIDNPTINPAGPFTAELWLDEIGTGLLLGSESFAGLAAGATAQMAVTWDIAEPDDRLLYVVVDSSSMVAEFAEDDNQAFVEADVQTLPDLIVTGGGVAFSPSFPKVGDVVHFDVLVGNAGDQASSVTLLELLDEGGAVIDSVAVPVLPGHSELHLGLDWDTSGFIGERTLRVHVDRDDVNRELIEDNNEAEVVVGVQDADIFLSDQIFSPNGDGIKDATTIFYRTGGVVTIETVDGRLIRTLTPEGDEEHVVWDGLSDKGNLAPDGLYVVVAGEVSSWAVVDINRFAVTNELEQRLLVGFLQPRVPGQERPATWDPDRNIERSWFTSMITSPVAEEIYLVERYHAEGTATDEDTFTLSQFVGDQMIELGELSEEVHLLSVDAAGSKFVTGYVWGGSLQLLHVPDMTLEEIDAPFGGSAFAPWISPDGRWLLWVSDNNSVVHLESLENPGETFSFYPDEIDDTSVCGYSVSWTPLNEAVVSFNTWSQTGFFFHINTATSPPSASSLQAQGWIGGCGDGWIPTASADGPGGDDGGKHEVGGVDGPDTGLDFDQASMTWLTLEGGGGYGEAGKGTGTGTGLEASVFELADGSVVEGNGINLGWSDWETVYYSLSNNGHMTTVAWTGGGDKRADEMQSEPISHTAFDGFLWFDVPDEFRPGSTKAYSPVGQYLADWRSELARGLPLRMDDTLWTAPDTYMIGTLDPAQWYYSDNVPYFTPAANLKMRVKTRVLFGDAGVDLWVLATDRYLESYLLDYADLDEDPDAYHPIGLPTNEALYDQRWGTWIPPGNGRYRVRITGRDRAGNARSHSRRVTWNGDNDIANLYTESRYLSPRSSIGVKDTFAFHYTVMRPANLLFNILDSNGEVVAEIAVAADEIGPMTTIWDGVDSFGNPVADGDYSLAYGEASWPIIVDNTAPVAILYFDETRYVRSAQVDGSTLDENGDPVCLVGNRDEYLNEAFGSVQDSNLMDWEYQILVDETDDLWQSTAIGTDPFGEAREALMRRYGADRVANQRFRFVARDMAGNETIAEASYRDEWIRFTDSEPPCRRALNPCIFPERPEVDALGDQGGLFEPEEPLTLNLFYDTLLVQNTVWGELFEPRLEYREASLAGLPAGPWIQGAIEVGSLAVTRSFTTLDPPLGGICGEVMPRVPTANLTALYWDHPDLSQTAVEVRIIATNADGQEIVSEPRLFYPEVPLALRHLGVDHRGDIFKLTNLSDGVVRTPNLQIRRMRKVDGILTVVWEHVLPVVDRLSPGAEATFVSGCLLVSESREILRVEGTGGFGGQAVSNLVQVPHREGFSKLRSAPGSGYQPGSCPTGSPMGGGLFGVHVSDPCSVMGQEPDWPEFWVNRGGTESVTGRIPGDPTGARYSAYEILVDGVPVVTVDGPLGSGDFNHGFDLSQLSDGSHFVTERFSYESETGLLGQCPQTFGLTIDRSPPVLAISEPMDGAVICPDSSTMDVVLSDNDATPGRLQNVYLDGLLRATSADGGCHLGNYRPYRGADGSTYQIDELFRLEPGWHEVTASSVDRAGFASCAAPVTVYIPDLPHVIALAGPPVFSPVNTMGRAEIGLVNFTTNTPGYWEVSLERGGVVYQSAAGTVSEPDEEVEIVWDGTEAGSGLLAEDGLYFAQITARSPCGAEDTARVHLELDTTPPEIVIDLPVGGTEIGSVVEVVGRAWDPATGGSSIGNFEALVVEVLPLDGGTGDWTVVGGRNREFKDEAGVLATWLASAHQPGDYLLRVRAWDKPGNESVSPEIGLTLLERHFIESFNREPEIFSPNRDGVLDRDVITFSLFEEAVVTLLVVAGPGAPVATLIDHEVMSAQTGGHVVEWSGLTDAGEVAADGSYVLFLRAEDPSIPPFFNGEEERLTVVVDTTPPDLDLMNPPENALVALPLELIGSHVDDHPASWTVTLSGTEVDGLIVGTGSGAFGSGRMAVIEDGQIADGPYTATFEATDAAGNSAVLIRRFRVDNTLPAAEIFDPQVGVLVNTIDEPMALLGEVIDEHLREWSWSFAPGQQPDLSAFVVFRGGDPTQEDGVVDSFAWDASNLPDGTYVLRLAGIDELDQEGEARRPFIVDNTPPVVTLSQPSAGAIIADPVEIIGSVVEEHLVGWTLTLIPDGDEPLVPAMESGGEEINGVLRNWVVLPPDGFYVLQLEADDAGGNHSEVSVTVQIQTTPPSPPVIVSADVVDQDDVSLAWTPGPGPLPEAYHVYRDGSLITPVAVTDTTLTDGSLTTGTYVYTVRALSQAGVETDDSNPAEIVIDLRPPLAKIVLPGDGARVSDQVSIFGTASRESGFAGWQLWATFLPSGSPVLLGGGTAGVVSDLLTVWDTSQPAWAEGHYLLQLEARDIFGNIAVDAISVEVDNTAPSGPVLTLAFATGLDPDAVINDAHVEWTLDPMPIDLAGFYLYRNGQLANAPGPVLGSPAPFLITETLYDDRDLPDGTYVYFVTAADTAENESAASNESDPVVIDTRRPHAVIIDPPDGTEFELSTQVTAQCEDLDVESVVFEFMPDGGSVWTPMGAPLTSPSPWTVEFAPAAAGLYFVRAVASDALGPDPDPAAIALIETDLPPGVPADLDLRVDGGDIRLSWSPVGDPHGDLAGYRVYRDGVLLTPAPLPPTQLDYDDSGLADGWYGYEVSSIDTADNESDREYADGLVSTPEFDFVYPVVSADGLGLSGRSDSYFDQVEFERLGQGGSFELMASLPFDESLVSYPSAPLNLGFNSFRFRGADDRGNRSRWSRTLVVVRHDPPIEPQNMVAVAIGSDVQVDWEPSADPDLFGYSVWRDDVDLTTTTSPYVYDGLNHQLEASAGDAAQWQRVVDGDLVTAWQPDADAASAGPWWQWTWTEAVGLDSLQVRWASSAYARRFSVEVQIDEQWLWWQYFRSNYSTLQSVDLGFQVTGVRITVPSGNWCNNCALAEVSLETLELLAIDEFLDSGLADQAYAYDSSTTNRLGQGSPLASANVLVGGTELAPPRNLVANADACNTVDLNWAAPEPLPGDPEGYRLYRAMTTGPFDLLVQLASDRTGWLDAGLEEGVTHHYRVTSIARIDGVLMESDPSNVATVVVACADVPPPVLFEPTVAGEPIDWPTAMADIGGRAWPGSDVTLLRDGSPVAGISLEAPRLDRIHALPRLSGEDPGMSISQDGRKVAYPVYGEVSALVIIDLETGEHMTLARSYPTHLALSPMGDKLAFVDEVSYDEDVYLADLETGDVRRLTDDGLNKSRIVFSPDGRTVAMVTDGGPQELVLVNVATGNATTLYTDTSWNGLAWPVFSPDGSTLAVKTWSQWRLFDLSNGDDRVISSSNRAAMTLQPFSHDGRYLCWTEYPDWVAETAIIRVYDLIDDEFVDVMLGQTGVIAASFVDGETLAFLRVETHKAEPVTGGDVEVVYRSVVDGSEQVLTAQVARSVLAGRNDDGEWSLIATTDGSLWVPQREEMLGLWRPTGRFTIPDVPLRPGVNTFVASQLYRSRTADSLPIEVNVAQDLFGDAEVLEVGAVPAFPIVGDEVLIGGVVRNAGRVALNGLVVTLVRIDEAGIADSTGVDTVDLAPGAFHRVQSTWDTTGQPGDHVWVLSADGINAIPELDETNNRATVTVAVRENQGAEAAISTPQPGYQLGSAVPFEVRVTANSQPQDTRVVTRVETAAGAVVETIDDRILADFGPGAEEWALLWPSDEVYHGDYRGRVVLTTAAGDSATSVVEFRLNVVTAAAARGTVDRPSYVRGDRAQLTAAVSNTGQAVIAGATVQLAIETAGGGVSIAMDERSLATLSSGGGTSLSWSWSTTEAPPGLFQFVVRVLAEDGGVLAVSDPVPFVVETEGAELSGSISVDPHELEPGEDLAISGGVENLGDQGLFGVEIAVEIVDLTDGLVVDRMATTVDLPPGALAPVSWGYVPSMTRLDSYVVVLSAERHDVVGLRTETLASTTFTLVDRTPPELVLLEPESGPVCDIVDIRARATDALSPVVRVTYLLDERLPEVQLGLESVEDTVFASRWFVQTNQLGTHQISVYAEDEAGNIAGPVQVDVEALDDRIPPVLDIFGPADDTCVSGPVSVIFSAADDHLESVVATLDGQPYFSGDAIEDGAHLLQVEAVDFCGHLTHEMRTFVVDSLAPAVTISGVADGGSYLPPVDLSWLVTDANLFDTNARLNGAPVLSPLMIDQEGAYLLEIDAVDCAGHQTTMAVSFTVGPDAVNLVPNFAVSPPQVEPPNEVDAAAEVSNQGIVDLQQVTLGLRLVDPQTGATLDFRTHVADIAVGASTSIHEVFPTIDLNRQIYSIRLEASGSTNLGTFDQIIDSESFEVVDRTPPVVTVVTPSTGLTCDPVQVVVEAVDGFSGVETVWVTLDGDPEPVMLISIPGGPPGDLWGTDLSFGPDGGGVHTLQLFASDVAANVSEPLIVEIDVDVEAPILTIDAPPDGTCTSDSVTLAFEASDPGLELVEAQLNGQQISSPVVVEFDGDYAFTIVAEDACGLIAEYLTAFVIDTVEPSIVITGVADGGVYDGGVVAEWLADDVNLLEVTATLDGAVVTTPLSVTSQGEHLLRVEAVDCAGNYAEQTVVFTVEGQPPLELSGTLQLSAVTVERGIPITMVAEVSNDGAAVVDGLTARLRVVNSTTGALSGIAEMVMSLPVGTSETFVDIFDTSSLQGGIYRVELWALGEYAGEPYELELAQEEFELLAVVPIPVLGGIGRLVLLLLLIASGVVALRRLS